MLQGIHNDRTHGGHIKHLENFVASVWDVEWDQYQCLLVCTWIEERGGSNNVYYNGERGSVSH